MIIPHIVASVSSVPARIDYLLGQTGTARLLTQGLGVHGPLYAHG